MEVGTESFCALKHHGMNSTYSGIRTQGPCDSQSEALNTWPQILYFLNWLIVTFFHADLAFSCAYLLCVCCAYFVLLFAL